jgi:hypothetical protein
MKLLIILTLLPALSMAQVSKKVGAYISFAVAGAFDGIAESVKFHKLGEGNKFWDAKTSWQNKWKNGDIKQGEKFFGSSTVFVRTQDGYHFARGLRNDALVVGVAFAISGGEKKKLIYYLIDAVLYMVSYRIGFAATYYTTGKNKKL